MVDARGGRVEFHLGRRHPHLGQVAAEERRGPDPDRTTKSSVASSAVDANLPANAAMLAAKAPLEARTTYNVRVSGYVQAVKGGRWVQFKTRTWSFTTA